MFSFLLIILCIFILLFLVAFFGSNLYLKPKRITREDSFPQENIDNFFRGFIDSIEKEPFSIINTDGNEIHGEWLFPKSKKLEDLSKVLICCHGFSWNLTGGYKYSHFFLEQGWAVLLYDHQRAGKSQGKHTTMGFLESRDLGQIVSYVLDKKGPKTIIGTHGESMGAATVLEHMTKDSRISFAIADCGYADLSDIIFYQMKSVLHFKSRFILLLLSLVTKMKAGFFLSDVNPAKHIAEAGGVPYTPLMVIHGLSDSYIPSTSAYKIFKEKKGVKHLYLCPEAHHAKSVYTNPENYEKQLKEFLKKINLE